MHKAFFVLTFACCIGFSTLDQQDCHYVYNYACYANQTAIAGPENKTMNSDGSCSVENLKDDVKYTLKLPKRSSKSIGLLEVKFSLPSAKCNYEVALLVNSSITNEEDCKNVEFHRSSAYEQEIHSEEKTVCVSNETEKLNCTGREFSMWYRHVFTGCYALRFTVDGYTHAVLGKQFIVTNYNRTEVAEPKFRCHYDDPIDAASPNKQDLVTFALSISVHADTAGMILTLTSMSFREDTKEDSCVRYSEDALYKWHIITDGLAVPKAVGKNCRMTTVEVDNDTSTRDTECKFDLRSPRNSSYCLEIEIEDDRCSRQTVWNPPPNGQGGKPPCTWLQRCTRIPKNTAIVEYNGLLRGVNETGSTSDVTNALVPVAITVVITILILSSAIFYVCHKYLANPAKPIYVNANLKGGKIEQDGCEMDSIESTDVDFLQNSIGASENKDKNKPIVLLYARGAKSFMNLMVDLRLILETHCRCRVRDWYDASEWDEVARIGPSAWVADLLREKYRAVWIDTPRARKILDVQWRNRYLGNSRLLCSDEIDEAVSDFRDAALPTVLETAKRNVTSLEYNKHFVVRLASCDANNGSQHDPFEDLSPHTRYLISHNLKELCSHLTSSTTRPQEQLLNDEQLRLRERVEKMEKNSGEVLETLN